MTYHTVSGAAVHERPGFRDGIFGFITRAAETSGKRCLETESRRQARQYERLLANCSLSDPSRGPLMLSVGQAYNNGGDPLSAISALEAAQPLLEGAFQPNDLGDYSELASLYAVLGSAYLQTGQAERAEAIYAQALSLAAETEARFGLQTKFYEQGRLVMRVVG